jgi:hypothetical protein
MMRHVHVRWAVTLTALLIVSAAVGLTAYAIVIKAQAQAILQDVSQLKVGVSPATDFAQVTARHENHLKAKNCGPDQCTYYFSVRNRWLAGVRIEPEAVFQTSVTVDHDIVRSISVWVVRDTRVFPTMDSGGMIEEYVEYPKPPYRADEPHYGFPTPVGKPYLNVVLDSHATPEQRRHAYAFSLRCLVKPGGGCDLPCDYLPLAWKDWEAELKSEGWGFGDYYPGRARCN